MKRFHIVVAVLLVASAGCARQAPIESPPAAATTAPAAVAMFAAGYPVTPAQRPTTAAAIYLGNLDARIEAQRAILERADDPAVRTALAASLQHRFHILGRVEDAELALAETGRALHARAGLPEALVLRAALLSTFHRFAESRAALDAARKAGAGGAVPARLARDLDLAGGRYDALAEEFAKSSHLSPELDELAFRAELRMLKGDLQGASRLLRAAQDLIVDVDPLTLAWLHSQQGIALLRVGDYADAKRFFEAAHERLPQYSLATEHLAETEWKLGNLDRSRALYREVIAQTGNPEFVAALAQVERAGGNARAAARLEREAESGYRTLLGSHRAGYAQHAAEFYLAANKPTEALTLARENIALRQDISSEILLARSAFAAGAVTEACEARGRAIATGLSPPELTQLSDLAQRCP